MRFSRYGMTLFELLIVMIIIGIVYSVGMFTLKKQKVATASVSVSTLKQTLLSLSQPNEIRMLCDVDCKECRVFSADDGKILTNLHLQSDGEVLPYGFDRFGELKKRGKVVSKINDKLVQGCFEISLYPDGTVTPLILKSKDQYYAYTPLGEDKPYIAKSEEALRRFLFNDSMYPLRNDDFYDRF